MSEITFSKKEHMEDLIAYNTSTVEVTTFFIYW